VVVGWLFVFVWLVCFCLGLFYLCLGLVVGWFVSVCGLLACVLFWVIVGVAGVCLLCGVL